MAFHYRANQGAQNHGSGVTTLTTTMTSNPNTGNTICVAIIVDSVITSVSVKDSANNVYTLSPSSPSPQPTGGGQVWLAYLLSAPSNANRTVTASWTSSTDIAMFVDEFSNDAGSTSFDTDASADTNTAGTAINTPSITPTGSGELLYAAVRGEGTLSAPTANSSASPWTGVNGALQVHGMAEYDLSASSATAVNFTQSSGVWSAMAMAFTTAAVTQPYEDDSYQQFQPPPVEPTICVW